LTINHSSSAAWTKEYAELDPLDLFMVNQDNLGMKQKSKQALNVQFTISIFQKTLTSGKRRYTNSTSTAIIVCLRLKTSWKQICSNDANTNTLAKRIIGVCEKQKYSTVNL
jgi:hypothetical protein